MLHSFCSPSGSTSTVGGPGGEAFSFSEAGQQLKRLELRCGEKTNRQIQGLVVTLSNDATASFGKLKNKGQIAWTVELQTGETVSSLTLYSCKQGCSGVLIKTSVGVHVLGHAQGTVQESTFHKAQLLGVLGMAGENIDRLGFLYTTPDDDFCRLLPLPEQRYVWKSSQGQPRLTTNLSRPFHTIHEIEVSHEQGEVIGVCARFSDDSEQTEGTCKQPPDVEIQIPKDGLIRTASIKDSGRGTLAELHLDCSLAAKQERLEAAPGQWVDINAQLLAVQLGWSETGRVNAIALLFSCPYVHTCIGHLHDPSSALESFESVQPRGTLHSMFSYVQEEAIRGIGFSFSNRVEIIRGVKATDSYASAILPRGNNTYTISTKKGTEGNADRIACIQLECPETPSGQPWSTFLGHPSTGEVSQEVSIKGSLVGAWGLSDGPLYTYGLISTSPRRLTPICGFLEKGTVFETDCLYSTKRGEVMGSVVCIRCWINRRLKIINGLQIQRAAAQSDACFITDVGTLSGKFSKIEIPVDFVVKDVQIAIAPVRQGRLGGVQITGETQNGEREELIIGNLDGTVYHHEWAQGARLVGLYGATMNDVPCALGLAMDIIP